ncbi:putative RiPP precursor [Mesorhizobium sp. WSM4303]|nr:putative RiPP precursor [Mesorhizobium sp. WSM4306]TRD04344.1 putative RiPP precursor [Mesorhizobium sp. WSM4303]
MRSSTRGKKKTYEKPVLIRKAKLSAIIAGGPSIPTLPELPAT